MKLENMSVQYESSGPSSSTWCYITKFVCSFDSLRAAKERYQKCVDKVRETHAVLLASEQTYNLGQSEPIFGLLLDEIIGFGEGVSESEREKYSVFIFNTIVLVPEGSEEAVVRIAAKLELDREDEVPAVFPSRTRSIMMSESGRLTSECISQ